MGCFGGGGAGPRRGSALPRTPVVTGLEIISGKMQNSELHSELSANLF